MEGVGGEIYKSSKTDRTDNKEGDDRGYGEDRLTGGVIEASLESRRPIEKTVA